MNEILILNSEEINALLTLPMAIRAVEQAYTEKSRASASLWPMVFHDFVTGEADLDIKSGDMQGLGCYGLKVVSWFGANSEKSLPALFGTSLLFDLATGAPRALLNAAPITDFRTGAAGALGAKYLARPDSKTLLMAGTGALAPYLVAATLYLMPQLETVLLVNPHHPEKAAAACAGITQTVDALLAASGQHRSASIAATDDLEAAARQSDIILTATPAREPYLRAEWLRAGTHLSCVGADMAGKQELDAEILRTARVFGDDAAQCFAVGECEAAHRAGFLPALAAELGDVIAGKAAGRTSAEELTVFDSTGIALQDLAAAHLLLTAAEEKGMGTRVKL